MRSTRPLLAASTLGSALLGLTAAGVRAAEVPAPAPDSRAPTAIEQALAERSCGPEGSADDAHYQCMNERVQSLRADFGYDLSRLSSAERKTIDSKCSRLRTAEGRDVYVACVSGELVSLHNKKARPSAAASPDAAAAADADAVQSAPVQPAPASSNWTIWLVGLLGAGVAAGAGVVVTGRIKIARHQCRTCGARVPPPGDLCANCRKQAAEALRHAAAERADQERAEQEERRAREQAEEQLRARADIEAQLQRERDERMQRARQEEAIRHRVEEALRQAEDQERQRNPGGRDDFDPYATLGVARNASQDVVLAAYEKARAKYDPNAVADMGQEAQLHFKTKFDAVERAYQMIAGSVPLAS